MSLTLETFSDQDWLDKMFKKSESSRTVQTAKSSLSMFEMFCVNQGHTKKQLIGKYQELFNQDKPDIRSICLSLDKFVSFLNEDHTEIILNPLCAPTPFKRKSPRTIRTYFGFVKSYLRTCHGIKLSIDDIKDFVTFPKTRKDQREPISIDVLKKIFSNAPPERRAFYYVLVTSGMRISEGLSLTKRNFHFNENPIRITLEADQTKTKESRETYITSEAYEKLLPLLETKGDDEPLFSHIDNVDKAVLTEEHNFGYLREKLGLTKKYPNSCRYVVNIHALRAYFHTKASQKHGSDYANALDGHGSYLKQYYREDPKERAKKYKELEPSLFIESVKMESEKTKDKIIESMQDQLDKLTAKMQRLELLNQ